MNIIYMGAPDFAVPGLEALAQSRHHIQAVVTHPDKKRSRGGRNQATPVKKKALEFDLPVIELTSMDDPEFTDALKKHEPDLFVVVAFRILPGHILEIPKWGAINLHASLLPKYRGAAPIHWAVLQGEPETGVTTFVLNEKMDKGAILHQTATSIGPNETTGELYGRLMDMGAGLLVQSVDDIETGAYQLITQDENQATRAPKIFREDARLDFNRPSEQVHNWIRGMSPKPGAWALLNNKEIKLLRSQLAPEHQQIGAPGNLRAEGNRLYVDTADGAVELLELQPENKKRLTASDFINGYPVSELELE